MKELPENRPQMAWYRLFKQVLNVNPKTGEKVDLIELAGFREFAEPEMRCAIHVSGVAREMSWYKNVYAVIVNS